jgi:2'-5' RNA ligase
MHVTLKFLGSMDEARLAEMARALAPLDGGSAPRARRGGLIGFPSERRARVLAVAIDDPLGEVAALATKIETHAATLDVPREERAYSPHVTLARARDPFPLRRWAGARVEPGDVAFPSVSLYRSDSTPSGARYTPLARAVFA